MESEGKKAADILLSKTLYTCNDVVRCTVATIRNTFKPFSRRYFLSIFSDKVLV